MFGIKAFFILLIVVLLTLSGALVFIKGFLLSRSVVELQSECMPEFALRAEDHTHHGVEGCWMHGRFKRAVVIIIDALRYDFLTFNTSLKPIDVPHYMNKLPVITQLMRRKPLHSRLYKFVADPPTTTMQRLKGLTTGSLPTFVDAGANFNSYAITEDNLIDQMIKRDKKVKFFGDDTWLSLFPNKFYKSFEFSSFDVKNLHSVDNGILKHIYSEMRRSDWDVIIAHFLGVDHCGHIYGPNHPIMGEKLTQMDGVLRNITELLRDDTVLFVMGDHGMTRTGDHGGDSSDELEAGLFIYSPAQLASAPQNENEENIVAQTDLVPTVALLLGLPIPFSNLGMVIPELFGHCPWWDTTSNEIRRVFHKVKALRLNAQQINTYLSAYQKIASDLPISKLRSLQQQINKAENDVQSLITAMIQEGATDHALQNFNHLEGMYKSYIRDAREMCEGVWAKFDLKFIAVGLLTIACGASQGLYFLIAWSNNEESLPTIAKFLLAGSILHLFYLAVHMSIFPETVPPLFAFIFAVVLIFMTLVCIRKNVNIKNFDLAIFLTSDNVISSVVLMMNCCIYFSNSFVVYEGAISIFFLQTLFCVIFLKIAMKNFSVQGKETLKSDTGRHARKMKPNFNLLNEITHPTVVTLICTLICCIILRLASYFHSCRKEQHFCEDSVFVFSLSSLEEGAKNQRYIFSILCIAAMVYAVRFWLKHYGNMNGTSPGVVVAYFCPPCAALFISLHWALQALPQPAQEFLTQWQQVLLAQIVYVLIISSLAMFIFSPLLVYMLPTRTDTSILIPYEAKFRHIVPTLYNQLKVRLSEPQDSSADDKPPVVYGLGSVYSASVVLLVSVVSLLLVLLLGDGMAPSLLLATALLYLYLELYSVSVSGQEHDLVSQGPSWSSMVMLSLLSSTFFFATGHQATIPSIRFESAYTGFYGDFKTYILPGFLIWLNTFAGPIFFSLACPTLVFWPLLSSAVGRWMLRRTSEQQGAWQGDFKMFDNATQLRKRLFRVCCGMITISSLKLLMTACAAALHRRHLMVWEIFAPRFVYEGAFFVTTSVCVLLVFLFVLKVDHSISKLINNIRSKKQS